MGDRTEAETVLLNKLVTDCITFGLKQSEALQYIQIQFGEAISGRTYRLYKTKVQSEGSTNIWLNYFTRIGFVQQHRKLLDDIQKIHDDSLKRYFAESLKPHAERNEDLILKIKYDIRENAKLLAEFNLSTPIISSIKQKLREKELERQKEKEDGIQVISGSP